MKDIIIDNDCASKHFASPVDPEYIKLINWLLYFEEDSENNAHLVISNKLLKEYIDSCRNSTSPTSLPLIVFKLTKEERIIKFSNNEIKEFIRKYFTKKITRKLTCNNNDRYHIPLVLMSYRKMALSEDKKFINDLINFPGFKVVVSSKPEDLKYDE